MLQSIIQLFFKTLSPIAPKTAARWAIELLFRTRRTKRKPYEINFWAKGREHSFTSGCKGRIFGEGEKSIWVIHGWGSRGSKMGPLVNEGLKAGYRVVVWDGPGHGDSPGHRSNLAYSARTLAKDVATFGELPEAIVGHSFGAASAAYACRLGLSVEQLVLISGPTSSLGFFKDYWRLIGLGQKASKYFVEFVENELQIDIDEMSAEKFINSLNQKVTVIHDENDKMIPVDGAKRLKQLRQDIDLFVTEKQGHHRILKYPPALRRVGQALTRFEPQKFHGVFS